MATAYIVDAVRTAGGRRGGRLAGVHPVDLAAASLDHLVSKTGIDPNAIDDVVMGCVTQAGQQAMQVGRNAVLASKLLPRLRAMPSRYRFSLSVCGWARCTTSDSCTATTSPVPASSMMASVNWAKLMLDLLVPACSCCHISPMLCTWWSAMAATTGW